MARSSAMRGFSKTQWSRGCDSIRFAAWTLDTDVLSNSFDFAHGIGVAGELAICSFQLAISG